MLALPSSNWHAARVTHDCTGSAGLLRAGAAARTPKPQRAAACSTARVWRGGACAQVLEGHGGAVQCVLALPSGDLLTGSNDTTVKLWRGGACVHTLTGHTDTVRRVFCRTIAFLWHQPHTQRSQQQM